MGKDGAMMFPVNKTMGEEKLGPKHDDRERVIWCFERDWKSEPLLNIVRSALLP